MHSLVIFQLGGLSEEQLVHDPEVEHRVVPPPPRLPHHRGAGGVHRSQDPLAGEQQH